MESAVVVYLRHIAYPAGFAFPLQPFPAGLLLTEVLREGFTLLMLLCAVWLAGSSRWKRLGGFLWSFAVWDLGYYLFLKLLLGWPPSLLTWDLLFLIPLPWSGPVLTPALNALTMLWMGWVMMRKAPAFQLERPAAFWLPVLLGCVLTIGAYAWPWLTYMLIEFSPLQLIRMDASVVFSTHAQGFIPSAFPWLPYLVGEACFIFAISRLLRK